MGTKSKIKLGLALQGGGAYGAFTKGALIRLLEHPMVQSGEIEIVAVSGTSAGAVNGAALVSGLNGKGPNDAIEKLTDIWARTAIKGLYNPLTDTPMTPYMWRWPNLPIVDVIRQSHKIMRKTVNMYDFWMSEQHKTLLKSIANFNWVREQIRGSLNKTLTSKDWNNLKHGKTKFFVNTVVRNPKSGNDVHYVFPQNKLRAKDIVASAALNFLGAADHHGVEMRDGAYLRNPCMEGLENESITDLMVISLHGHPNRKMHATLQADEMEVSGREVQTYHIHKHLTHVFNDDSRDYKMHEIAYYPPAWHMDSARMNTDKTWLDSLAHQGYQAADEWLRQNLKKLGKKDSYVPPRNVTYAMQASIAA